MKIKKTRILVVAALATTILVGAGYAQWNNKLTINNTISTGELKVEFVKGEYDLGIFGHVKYAPVAGTSEASYTRLNPMDPISIAKSIKVQAPYATAKIESMDSKTLNVTIDKLYPGTLALITARMQNNGSIPAKFDNVKLEWDTTNSQKLDAMKNKLMCAGGFIVLDKNGIPKLGQGAAFYGVKLGELDLKLTDMLKNVRLEKGESIALDIPEEYKQEVANNVEAYDANEQNCLIFYLPSTTSNEDDVASAKALFKIHINFKQHNM